MGVRLLALVPVFGLLLAGCTSSAQEPLPQPPPFSAGPTATPSALAIEVPPSARPGTPQGAAAFARHYVDVLQAAQQTADPTSLQQLSDPQCSTCNNLIAAVRSGATRGTRVTGGDYRILSAEASENAPGDAVADVFFERAAFQVLDPDGMKVGGEAAVDRDFLQMRVLHRADAWLVRGIRFPDIPK